MRELITKMIQDTATTAGAAPEHIMSLSASDNLTLPRPRVELNFLPASYTRTGRKLGITRVLDIQTTKKELYEVRLDVTAQVYADDAEWLADFEHDFVAEFPNGIHDTHGNWIRARIEKMTFTQDPTKRVGMKAIEVFTKLDSLFALTFTGRVTKDEAQKLITKVDIQPPSLGKKEKE